jgi:hypothetical protein
MSAFYVLNNYLDGKASEDVIILKNLDFFLFDFSDIFTLCCI